MLPLVLSVAERAPCLRELPSKSWRVQGPSQERFRSHTVGMVPQLCENTEHSAHFQRAGLWYSSYIAI